MRRTAKINTSDGEIDIALKRARKFAPNERCAKRAGYDQESDSISLLLASGVTVLIPRKYLQDLEKATVLQLSRIELLGGGTGLHWPRLDVSHYVPGLLNDLFGTKQWMVRINREGVP